jgi:MOSC domain-containing protein YiiM
LCEGDAGANDNIELLSRDDRRIAVSEITRLYAFDKNDVAAMRRAVEAPALPASWRGYFRDRFEKQTH